MAWIFSLWGQCRTHEEASAFAAHFERQRWLLADGTVTVCSTSLVAGTCCWVQPTSVSRAGATDAKVAAQLTELGERLYERLRSAPSFLVAVVGVEVDDLRTEEELDALIRDSRRPYPGLVVATELWRRAGQPPHFETFREGYVWVRYEGERAPG